MRILNALLITALLCNGALAAFDRDNFAKKQTNMMRADMEKGNMDSLSRYTDRALDHIVVLTLQELRDNGQEVYADQKEAEWMSRFHGYVTTMMAPGMRGQGDHKPLVQFLVDIYEKCVATIGLDATKALHISDLATFSWTIPVVFHPCTFPMDQVPGARIDEYRRHFAKDDTNDRLYGLVPVVSYWVVDISCMAATSGIAGFLCGPVASAGEFVMGKYIAPKLSDKLYVRQCGN